MGEILIFSLVLFFAGGILLLERRSLGQMAVVQPLVVCFLAGWALGMETLGLFFGICLQLLSTGLAKDNNWPLAGLTVAASMAILPRIGVEVALGQPQTIVILLVAMVCAVMSGQIECIISKRDGAVYRQNSPWLAQNPVRNLEVIVYKTVGRWIFTGGIEVLAGTGLIVLTVVLTAFTQESLVFGPWVPAVIAVCVLISVFYNLRAIVWTGVFAAAGLIVFI